MFGLEEGKVLGHIIPKYGIRIDPRRISSIQKMDIPRSKKEIVSFIGGINFLRRFSQPGRNFKDNYRHVKKGK